MSFVSTEFAVFFLATFVAYHSLASVRWQNTLIVLASYVFYAWWDWRFTPLLLAISLVNYFSALAIERAASERIRKRLLIFAVSVSLAALAAFKYFGFFVDTAAAALEALGLGAPVIVLEVALPLGISFMTFQGLAYVVDVWRRDHAAEPDLIKFLAFKAFFPQLIAGPIERASNLLDQFGHPRSIDSEKVARGVCLLVCGYAMKIVVADSMSQIVNVMFLPDQPSVGRQFWRRWHSAFRSTGTSVDTASSRRALRCSSVSN